MIIKIKTPGMDNWRFYDNARAVQTKEVPYDDVPTIDHLPGDNENYSIDHDDIVEEVLMDRNIPIPIANGVLLISFMTGDIVSGKAVNLYTNSQTYLLNDDGKTIERLF